METEKGRVERQIGNLLAALAMMQEVPPDHVAVDLGSWLQAKGGTMCGKTAAKDVVELKCGSAACFGGWVGVTRYFKRQGVTTDDYGEPILRPRDGDTAMYGEAVPLHLFGDRELFHVLGAHPADWVEGKGGRRDTRKEKDAVIARIDHALVKRLYEQRRIEVAEREARNMQRAHDERNTQRKAMEAGRG